MFQATGTYKGKLVAKLDRGPHHSGIRISEASSDHGTDFYSHVGHFTQARTQAENRLPTYNFSVTNHSTTETVIISGLCLHFSNCFQQ